MKITARGWYRNMGDNVLGNIDLSGLKLLKDEYKYDFPTMVRGSGPNSFLGVEIRWKQELKLTGNYCLEVHFSRSDVLRLFKSVFGTELDASLIKDEGFTISPELVKSILRTVKLSDLTLGELVAMQGVEPAATEVVEEKELSLAEKRKLRQAKAEEKVTEKVAEPTNVTSILRRKL